MAAVWYSAGAAAQAKWLSALGDEADVDITDHLDVTLKPYECLRDVIEVNEMTFCFTTVKG